MDKYAPLLMDQGLKGMIGKGKRSAEVREAIVRNGAVYFAEQMLNARGENFNGKTAVVSGAGNVAIYAIEKLQSLGAKAVTCSDSSGIVYDPY